MLLQDFRCICTNIAISSNEVKDTLTCGELSFWVSWSIYLQSLLFIGAQLVYLLSLTIINWLFTKECKLLSIDLLKSNLLVNPLFLFFYTKNDLVNWEVMTKFLDVILEIFKTLVNQCLDLLISDVNTDTTCLIELSIVDNILSTCNLNLRVDVGDGLFDLHDLCPLVSHDAVDK